MRIFFSLSDLCSFSFSKVNYSIVPIVSRSDFFVSVFLHLQPVVVKSDILDLYAFNV